VICSGPGTNWNAFGGAFQYPLTDTSDGTIGPVIASYDVPIHANSGACGTWSMTATAASTGDVDVAWDYQGNHSSYQTTADLQAFVFRPLPLPGGVVQSTSLVSVAGPPGNPFQFVGPYTFHVQPGDVYGFTVTGSNFDFIDALRGTLYLTGTGASSLGIQSSANPAVAGSTVTFTANVTAIVMLADALGVAPGAIRAERVADRAWEREWLKDFHSMRFGERLWIVPSHEVPSVDPRAVIVRLDPGLAFGTGTHASTALCLEWLDANFTAGSTAIDYGCGSGVLAVAAARLGAIRVHAFDIDPQALIATHDNAQANQVDHLITIHDTAASLPPGADVVLANILAGTLIELAPALAALARPGGQLVLAGILDSQAEEVRTAFAPHATLRVCGQRDGWTALSGYLLAGSRT